MTKKRETEAFLPLTPAMFHILLALADDFKASGYSFPVLVRKITALSQYRRVR